MFETWIEVEVSQIISYLDLNRKSLLMVAKKK